jgi:hypothetical protein
MLCGGGTPPHNNHSDGRTLFRQSGVIAPRIEGGPAEATGLARLAVTNGAEC